MPVYRTEIERALDEIISNEEGMKFQGLAVVLVKQKFPELIAAERHNDLGLDAYAAASRSRDGIGKGLASSTTAEINKIKKDIERFQSHYADVKVLFFATPCQVTKQTEEKWKDVVLKKYNIELVIIPREDIITDLMKPTNISLCQSHLNIQVVVEPKVGQLFLRAREATVEILQAWLARPGLTGKPKIELLSIALDKEGRQTGEAFSLPDLSRMLQEGRRIVLEAPAGRGKTTTLLQLSERLDQLTFLIDLPAWVKSNNDILEFISKMPQFLSRGIDATALAQIYNALPCSFLLNGWNEVSDSYSDKAVSALSGLDRNFPKAGIIVATRTHHIKPPLPGSFRVQLFSLNRRQRLDYLNQTLANRAVELISQLENDRVLDELTRTPLILSEVVNIFLSGAIIPKTKIGILDAVIRLAEESDEHRDHLVRSPLLGMSRNYLFNLAMEMMKSGIVTMEEARARSVINSISSSLQVEGQIVTLPEPAEILSVLCAHHVLERLEYPSIAFRFQHQQFQEWYVSMVLRKYLLELVVSNDHEIIRSFVRDYINIPFWEEPLRMIAEDIGCSSEDSSSVQVLVKAGSMLVDCAMDVDLVFAAELARLCGKSVWSEVKDKIGQHLRSWYQTKDASHKRCALAGMIASGAEDFKDILLPLLTSEDQQARLKTYRSFGEFYVSSLGVDWKQIVKTWKDDCRADFIGEVVREPHMAAIAEEFARIDPSPKVRGVALTVLEWINATEALIRVLLSYDDDTLKEVLRKRILHEIPQESRGRIIVVYNMLLQEIDVPKDRIRILLVISEIGGENIIENIKEELTNWPFKRVNDEEELLISSAIELVQKSNQDWVSSWVAERIIGGLLWSDRWTPFILSLSQDFKQNLLKRISEEVLEYRDNSAIMSILGATADVGVAGDVFSRLYSLQITLVNPPGGTFKTQWEIIRQLQDLFRAMPSEVAISGMFGRLSSEFNPVEYQVAIELFGRIGDTGSDLRGQLPDDLRQALRIYLKKGVNFVLSQDDFSGALKSELATALARVGDSEDMDDLNKLIQADIERMRKGQEAWHKGDRGPISNGANTSWSNWHVRAVECLDFQGAEHVLLRLLCEPEYEQSAAKALIRLARVNSLETQEGSRRIDYQVLWNLRSNQQKTCFCEDRRLRYVNAIKQRIVAIREQQSKNNKPDSFVGRLKTLACIVAILDGRASVDLIIEIMSLPGQWDGWPRAEALEALLFNGTVIKADAALKVLDPVINHIIQPQELHNDQNRFLLQRYLRLLPFIDPPSAGIARIKEIITTTQIPMYDLREMLLALGNSRCDDALDLLLELHTKYGDRLNHIRSEWINAIAALNTPKAKQIFLSFIFPDVEPFKGQQNFEHHDYGHVAEHLANIIREDPEIRDRAYELCKTKHSSMVRSLLAKVVSQIGTSEALVAGLSLINDQLNPPIPYELLQGLENAFLGRQPYGGGQAYIIKPMISNEIRNLLFEMTLKDKSRKHAAWQLLGQIEAWRLEYGRPDNEPRHPDINSGEPWIVNRQLKDVA